MTILIGFLTVVLVLNCIFLILLVLIQLPKKEAGIGVAFGGGATEALFGAGSGNVLTKATKYAAGIFMGLALVLSILNAYRVRSGSQSLEQELQKRANAPATMPVVTNTPVAPTMTSAPAMSTGLTPNVQLISTNLPSSAPPASNPPANSPAPPAQ